MAKQKKRPEKQLTKAMLVEKMNEMAGLVNAMEYALQEWEVWKRLIPMQKKGLTDEEFMHFLADGPPLSDLSGKIMESIRRTVPEFVPKTDEELEKEQAPGILDANGNVMERDDRPDIIEPGQSVIEAAK